MIVTVFRSRLLPGVQRATTSTEVDRMIELAATMPGYISHKGFTADDGERVTIVEFEPEEGSARLAHAPGTPRRPAQRRARFITPSYSVQVCEVKRAFEIRSQRARHGGGITLPEYA